MSEIEGGSYIFGSFNRRKCSSMTATVDPPYEKASLKSAASVLPALRPDPLPDEFICNVCKRQVVDPRVLACFHSFCLACLHDWFEGRLISGSESHGSVVQKSEGGSGSSTESAVSGYESDIGVRRLWNRQNCIQCPQCGAETKVPAGGLTALPPHYILQHRMLIASLNEESVCFLCDLCSTDIPAVARCTPCLLNLCLLCSEAHKRQRGTAVHDMVNLRDGGRTEPAISMVRRQIMCSIHTDKEHTLYCSACEQVVCRDCCLLLHRGHPCELIVRASQVYTTRLRERLGRARQLHREATLSASKLNVITQRIERRCTFAEEEIDRFVENYKKALDQHACNLKEQVVEARKSKLQVIEHHQVEIDKLIEGTNLSLKFTDDLINEGSETEILSFAAPLLRKLDDCIKNVESSHLPELKVLETLNFLPNERAGVLMNKQMFGVITTQRISASHCSLAADALNVLNNCRQQQKCDVILVTRDGDGQLICHGGETVSADVRYRDVSHRSVPVSVVDRQDGSYAISFVPDSAGNMILTVAIKGAPVKGSPFPVCVRTLRPHHGTFHCCSFCSSGGRKETSCGCGGQMPGGYRGCGHGHTGHPGRRHWSCCGNVLHNSECGRPPAPAMLHFSL